MVQTKAHREIEAWEIASSFSEGVVPMFNVRGVADEAYVSDVANTKRMLERLMMDDVFRTSFHEDPQETCDKNGIDVDVEVVRALWDDKVGTKYRSDIEAGHPVPELSRSVRRYQSFIAEKLALREWMRDAKSSQSGRFGLWRLQQVHRCTLELGQQKSSGLVHATVAFELQKGCSVGCWFCGVGAEKFTGHVAYTEENAKLWRETLNVCEDVIGDTVYSGFCYWASDPLDNPDYLHFIEDFRDAYGRYPQTTTAIPMRDEEMTRKVLEAVKKDTGEIQRFSILTRRMLLEVHEAFTAEELINVELLPLNKESNVPKANAGRARVKSPKGHAKTTKEQPQTIACVSGFLFNMLERSVKLITPCHASDKWPNGYWVISEGTFNSGDELRLLLLKMIETLQYTVETDMVVALNPCLSSWIEEGVYHVESSWVKWSLPGFAAPELLDAYLKKGAMTAAQVALEFEANEGIPLEATFNVLNELMRLGALDCEPKAHPETLPIGREVVNAA